MKFLNLVHVIVSALLIVSILLQSRGSGLSTVFGGGMGGYHTKRGFERFLFYSSITLAVLFVGLAIVNVIF
ncbi:MAG: preprotein translocase subunit SecG [Candidatus Moranbacteria bacterium]|nr:preprotein translocase subunit SecG [Candidatus Moranbacteria bacterium]